MVVWLRWENMVDGFFGEDFCKLREFFGEDNRGFCLICVGSELGSSGKSGHYWGPQDEAGVSSNDPMESSISFGLGDKLVFSYVV